MTDPAGADATREVSAAVRELLDPLDVFGADGRWSEAAERAACERLAGGGWLGVGLAEELGGSGGSLPEAAAVTRACAAAGHRLPAADAGLVAGHVLALAGLTAPAGLVVPVPVAGIISGGRIRVHAPRVPFARWATSLLLVAGGEAGERACLVDAKEAMITPGHNLGGEPRDTVDLDGALPASVSGPAGDLAARDVAARDVAARDVAARDVAARDVAARDVAAGDLSDQLHRAGALARAIQIAAAIERMLELAVIYCGQRQQFGRRLSQFQAVQQQLALLAGEALAARAAVQRALTLLEPGPWPAEPVAVAKARAGLAATTATQIAHQVHGAIGITAEYPLHRFTTAAWAWREEYGSERSWSAALSRDYGAGLWEAVTSGG